MGKRRAQTTEGTWVVQIYEEKSVSRNKFSTEARLAESGVGISDCLAFDSLESAVGGLIDAGFDLLSEDPLATRLLYPPRTLKLFSV